MAESVHRQLLKSLHEAEWLDEETRARAFNKAKSVSLQVGYPKELKDAKRVTDYYSRVRPDGFCVPVNDEKILIA